VVAKEETGMITAQQAKNTADKYYDTLVENHAKEFKRIKEKEQREIEGLKDSGRFAELVKKIEDHVERISAKGGRSLSELKYMAFYLNGKDTILYTELMNYFKGQGFNIKEYSDFGLQLQW
jgi:hypothetical protein